MRAQAALAESTPSSPTSSSPNPLTEAVIVSDDVDEGDDDEIPFVPDPMGGDADNVPGPGIAPSADGTAAPRSPQSPGHLPEASVAAAANAEASIPTPTGKRPTSAGAPGTTHTRSSSTTAAGAVEAAAGRRQGSSCHAGAAAVVALKRLEDLGLEVGAYEHAAALFACAGEGCGGSALAVLRYSLASLIFPIVVPVFIVSGVVLDWLRSSIYQGLTHFPVLHTPLPPRPIVFPSLPHLVLWPCRNSAQTNW